MKRSEFICKNCLCRIDPKPGDVAKDLCALLPDYKPITPEHFCGSGKWKAYAERVVTLPGDTHSVVAKTMAILTYGDWDDAE
jgi:hypothetical protein